MGTSLVKGTAKAKSSTRHLTIDVADLEAAAKTYVPKARPWTAEEKEIVLQFYGKVPRHLLAKKFNRSAGSVEQVVIRMRREGIKI